MKYYWAIKNTFGDVSYLHHNNRVPMLFKTRREAKVFTEKEYGYIKTRKDLRSKPFNWRFPRAIKVIIQEK